LTDEDHDAKMINGMGVVRKFILWLAVVPILGAAPLWAGMIAYANCGATPDVGRLCSNCVLVFFAGGVVGSSVYTLAVNNRMREAKFVIGIAYLIVLLIVGLGMYIPDVRSAMKGAESVPPTPFGILIAQSALTSVALLYGLLVEYSLERGRAGARWITLRGGSPAGGKI